MAELKNILVVDDDPTNIEILVEHLEDAGYVPHVAENGAIAWGMLEKNPEKYQAVLLDRMMPELDGMEVLKRIRENELMNLLPVIMQTAKATNSEVLEGLQAGAYYYLTKPFSKASMLAIIKTAVADTNKYLTLKSGAKKAIGTFSLMYKGGYYFKTLKDADALATIVINICPDPERSVIGLSELLINAVEHGNLGLTYDDKSRLIDEEKWYEEIDKRLTLPEFSSKRATLEIDRNEKEIRFIISDEGEGFEWEQYLEISPERAFDTHGRGIAMSKSLSFDSIEYVGNGNKVIAIVNL